LRLAAITGDRINTGRDAEIAVAAVGVTRDNLAREAAVSRILSIHLPDDIYRELERQATVSGKSVEQLASERVAEARPSASRGGVDALSPFFGAWQMSPEERSRIETMLAEERHLE
jgi:hypothetical protein